MAMIIAASYIEIHIPAAQSLKAKRQVLKSLKDRIRGAFNVAIAEVGSNDLWQRADLGIACVGNDAQYLNGLLDHAVDFIRNFIGVELLHYEITIY